MSSWKYGRHWYGHILVSEAWNEPDPEHNVVAIHDAAFQRIAHDLDNLLLPTGVEAEWIGVDDARFTVGPCCAFLATGHTFTEAWKVYGTVVNELHDADRRERDSEYLRVMLERYGLDLSNHPIRMMVGVNTEH